ncbi:CrcB-like protein-domain-containing protein [Peziza echinospora]|nr:CrcB-like protein-domain-containing protein [Peziza echinospora]
MHPSPEEDSRPFHHQHHGGHTATGLQSCQLRSRELSAPITQLPEHEEHRSDAALYSQSQNIESVISVPANIPNGSLSTDPSISNNHRQNNLPVNQPLAVPDTLSKPPSPITLYSGSKTNPNILLLSNSWIVFFSIWGTLSRLGFIAFTDFTGAPIGGGISKGNGVIWANFTGCVIIGFLIQDGKLFSLSGGPNQNNSPIHQTQLPPKIDKSSFPLYVGLATGYCGSLTSFSSYMVQSFYYLSNNHPAYPHTQKGFSVLSFLAYIILTISLSVSGFQIGTHIASSSHSFLPAIPRRALIFLDKLIIPVAILSWIGAILMAIFIKKWRGDALFACVFSPVGALLRFWISRHGNPVDKRFPVGTFIVNMLGTAVLAGVTVGQYGHYWPGARHGIVGCQVLKGIGDGFCGCLTTVSTWIAEIVGLKLKYAYSYALITVIVGILLMIVILGSFTWSHGLDGINIRGC